MEGVCVCVYLALDDNDEDDAEETRRDPLVPV